MHFVVRIESTELSKEFASSQIPDGKEYDGLQFNFGKDSFLVCQE